MSVLPLILISIGIAFLMFSLKPACSICQQDNHIGWKVLLGLIGLFILGYLYFLIHLITHSHSSENFIEDSLTFILFAGSIFVKLIIDLSLKSIKKLKKTAFQEEYNSLHDSLTELPNRKFFLRTLNEKVKLSKPFSLFVIDINRFKQINDMLGHYFADQTLIRVGDNIKKQLNSECFLSRISGDQYMLICCALSDKEISQLMGAIYSSFKIPFNINNYNLKIDISCGGTLFPKNGESVGVLLQQADIALRSAKEKQNDYVIYNDKLDNDAKSRLEISSKLHNALTHKEFEVYYQPINKVNSDGIYHLEALVRWPQKEGGFIPPDQFIPIAEQNNLIKQITFFVLNRICKNLYELKKNNTKVCVHINLSARDLKDNALSEQLAELIEVGVLLPHELILEVTETAIMEDLSKAKKVLKSLSEQGFVISLDDFGTGYSSLSMLLELPINQIKIDRSFVMSMQQEEIGYQIVKSIIFMAHNLNCTVVAEGVETKDVVDELTSLSCDYLQGYFYSKALGFSALTEYCKEK